MITLDLFDTLQTAWTTLCAEYDVTTALPEVDRLLEGADPSDPGQAAQVVVVNCLLDIMESVSRFSPWYRQPTSKFGISPQRDPCRWTLTERARRSHQVLLDALEDCIRCNRSVILATRHLEHVDQVAPCRAYTCKCVPPRTILVHQSVHIATPIVCDTCHQPFL